MSGISLAPSVLPFLREGNDIKPLLLPTDDLEARIKAVVLQTASFLTTPVCSMHECYQKLFVVEELYPEASRVALLAEYFFLVVHMIACGALALVTTPVGIILRNLVVLIQKEPFLYFRGEGQELT